MYDKNGSAVTRQVTRWAEVPRTSALYAMYGGETGRTWVAYVGIAGNLNSRLVQHFVRRDSSVVTGTSAVGINIEHVRHVEWWEGDLLDDDNARHAAELIAFELLDPALRSRGAPRKEALELRADPEFRRSVERLLEGGPTGRLAPPRLVDVATTLAQLELRLQRIERLLELTADS
ncbi:hypothetical protein ACI79J_15395 [Geodermatophilus sp. SYSU D01062]